MQPGENDVCGVALSFFFCNNSTDEDLSLRMERFAIIILGGVFTKENFYGHHGNLQRTYLPTV